MIFCIGVPLNACFAWRRESFLIDDIQRRAALTFVP
jgi:hypothetical protein